MSATSNMLAYQKVCQGILALIVEQSLSEGDRLPSQRELASQFGVNQRTVIRGIAELADRGLVDCRVGSGVYINHLGTHKAREVANHLLVNHAKSLKQHLTICLVTDRDADLHVHEMIKQLQRVTANGRTDLLLRAIDYQASPESILQQILSFDKQDCDAMIVLRSHQKITSNIYTQLTNQSHIPIVFSRHVEQLDSIHYWGTEHVSQMDQPTYRHLHCDMVVQYLLGVGYERIGYCGPRSHRECINHAMPSFTESCAKRNLLCMVGLIDQPVQSTDEIVRQWMPFQKRTAVYCYDDQTAMRLLTSLHKHGIRIPQQVGIIGNNDTEICNFTDPPLTSSRFPFDYVARAMLHYVSTWAHNGHPSHLLETARPQLKIRQSCGGQLHLGMQLKSLCDELNHANRGKFHIQLQETES